jgi:hypothetical protein
MYRPFDAQKKKAAATSCDFAATLGGFGVEIMPATTGRGFVEELLAYRSIEIFSS